MENELRVRPVAASDDLGGLNPVWGVPVEAAESPPAGGLVVVRGERVVGLAVSVPAPPGVRIEQLHAHAMVPAAEVLSAVACACADERVELYARDAPELLDEVAGAAGFELVYRQVRVGRSLVGVTQPAKRHFTFRRFPELGRRGVELMLAGIWDGGDGPNGLRPGLELERLLDVARSGAGGRPDTSLWRVAFHEGEPAGAALVNDIGGRTGTLGYIGLLPALRGRGLGRALHAEALWLMRSSGLDRYEDGTEWDNAPMRAIFAAAGCEPIGSTVMFVHGPTRSGHRCEGGAALTADALRLPRGSHVSLLRKVRARSEAMR